MSKTRGHDNRRMQWRGPGWWHHLFTEKPNRRKTKLLEHDAKRLKGNDEELNWPVPKRPHLYYY